jgi:hypothetical protein
MKHPYHTLLPVQMQAALMEAALTENIKAIDSAVDHLHFVAPYLFHNGKSEALRTFHHEPRQNVLNAGFFVAFRGLRN